MSTIVYLLELRDSKSKAAEALLLLNGWDETDGMVKQIKLIETDGMEWNRWDGMEWNRLDGMKQIGWIEESKGQMSQMEELKRIEADWNRLKQVEELKD